MVATVRTAQTRRPRSRFGHRHRRMGQSLSTLSVLSDAPVSWIGDRLHFSRYVDPLVSIIASPTTQTPFNIGIFGAWGSGKTTLLEMTEQKLTRDYGDRFICVKFNPWTYRRESNMLAPMLNALRDRLNQDPKRRFINIAKRIGVITLNLATDEMLKRFSVGDLSIEKIGKVSQRYAEAKGIAETQLHQ